MAKTKKAQRKPRKVSKSRQTIIPGAEAVSLPDLDAAMEVYHDTKVRRMELLEKEGEFKAEVAYLMREHGVTEYKDESVDPPLVAKRTHIEEDDVSVKVVKVKVDVSANGESD